MPTKTSFIPYLHSFRGFAIFCVVAVHVGVAPLVVLNEFKGMDESNPIYMINETFFHNSTIYFALISGLLFSAVLVSKGWRRFFTSKFKYVLLPYLFFTVLLSIGTPAGPDGQGGFHPDVMSYLTAVGRNFLYGSAMPIYWYLPVLFLLYLSTPVLGWLVDSSKRQWLMLPVVLMPLVVSRQPVAMGEPVFYWQNVLFFLGVYGVGIWAGRNLDLVMHWIRAQRVLLMIIVGLSLAGIFYWYLQDPLRIGITNLRQSLHYLNKLAIAALALYYFQQLPQQPRRITALADDAFAIYFTHFIAIFVVIIPFVPLIQYKALYPFNVILSMVAGIFLTLLLTKGIIWLLKKLFGKYSRMVIGS